MAATRRWLGHWTAIPQHLRSLKQAGLVANRAQGRNVFYRPEKMRLQVMAPGAERIKELSARVPMG